MSELPVPFADRVVEVLCDRGEQERSRWRMSSGLLIGGSLVLTAAHAVKDGELTVRRVDKQEYRAVRVLVGTDERADLALLRVLGTIEVPRVQFASVDRDAAMPRVVMDCHAVGYPVFRAIVDPQGAIRQRETAQVDGEIPTAEGLVSGLLMLRVTSTPRPLPPREEALERTEWSGMSGAAVIAGDRVVGVITEHHPPAGESMLTVTPITNAARLPNSNAWWEELGSTPTEFSRLPAKDATRNAFAQLPATRRGPDFSGYVAYRTRRFVGRSFLLERVDNFLGRHRSGYFVLAGKTGVGKTAFLAKLATDRGYTHYFNVAAQNLRTPEQFLKAVCGQLVARYQLAYSVLPEDAGIDSSFLSELLAEVAQEPRHRPVVVVADALNESNYRDLPVGVNPLYLPSWLPDGAYFIVSCQRLADLPMKVETFEAVELTWESRENLADAAEYVVQALSSGLTGWRDDDPDRQQDRALADIIVAHSDGFPYLVSLLHGGPAAIAAVAAQELPTGVDALYLMHWHHMQSERGHDWFATTDAAILSLLAVAQEPVVPEQLARWARLSTFDVRATLRDWQSVLVDESSSLSLFHETFQKFVAAHTDITRAHADIAHSYLALETWQDDTYGVRYLAFHCVQADLQDALHGLLERYEGAFVWARRRRAVEGTYEGYLQDVEQGWSLSEPAVGTRPARLVRYALITSSIVALASAKPASLALALRRAAIWSMAETLSELRRISDVGERIRGLTALAGMNAGSDTRIKEQAWREALTSIQYLEHSQRRALALREIVRSGLPTDLFSVAADACTTIESLYWQSRCMTLLADLASEPLRSTLVERAIAAAYAETDSYYQAQALAAVAVHTADRRRQIEADAIIAAKRESDTHFQAKLFGVLAQDLSRDAMLETWPFVRAMPEWQEDNSGQWMAREHALQGYAPGFARCGLFDEALEAIALMQEKWSPETRSAIAETARWGSAAFVAQVRQHVMDALDGAVHVDHDNLLREILIAPGSPLQGPLLAEAVQQAFGPPVDAWLPEGAFRLSKFNLVAALRALASDIPRSRLGTLIEALLTRRAYVEQQDAPLLAELLVVAGNLEGALAVASDASSAVARADAFVSTMRAADSPPPDELLTRALIQANDIKDARERLRVVTAVAEASADPAPLLTEAVAIAERIDDSERAHLALDALVIESSTVLEPTDGDERASDRAVSLVDLPLLVSSVDADRLRKRLATLVTSEDDFRYKDIPSDRQTSLDDLFGELLEAGLAEEAVEAALAMKHAFPTHGHDYFARLIDAGAFATAIRSFYRLGEPWQQLKSAIQSMPASLLDQTMDSVRRIDDHARRGAVMASICARPLRGPSLTTAIDIVADLRSGQERAEALSSLSHSWALWAWADRDAASRMLAAFLRKSAQRGRPELLRDLTALAPLAVQLGGETGAAEMRAAILESCATWP